LLKKQILSLPQNKSSSQSLASIAKEAGAKNLIHSTSLNNLKNILKNEQIFGQRITGEGVWKNISSFYTELSYKEIPNNNSDDIRILIDLERLDFNYDYFINPGWQYGSYHPLSASPAVNIPRTAFYLKQDFLKESHEIVFTGPTPLTFIRAIYVYDQGIYQAILNYVEKENIVDPAGNQWNKIIFLSKK
jgi:hypothetical protein